MDKDAFSVQLKALSDNVLLGLETKDPHEKSDALNSVLQGLVTLDLQVLKEGVS